MKSLAKPRLKGIMKIDIPMHVNCVCERKNIYIALIRNLQHANFDDAYVLN